jgi:hypothetical protein
VTRTKAVPGAKNRILKGRLIRERRIFRNGNRILKIVKLIFKGLILLTALAFLLLAGARLYNHFSLQTEMDRVLEESPNQSIKIRLHYDSYVHTGILVFDIAGTGGPEMGPSILNLFFELASKMKDRKFELVKMAFRGRELIRVDGASFKRIGEDYGHTEVSGLINELTNHSTLPGGKPLGSIDHRVLDKLIQAGQGRGDGER